MPISSRGICAAIASTGTRLRLASNRPLIRCRLPGPQLPAHTANSPVSVASAAAANPAASSCRTCCQAIVPSRRSASVNPFSESPGMPYTRRTPDAFSVATMTSATVVAMICSLIPAGHPYFAEAAVDRGTARRRRRMTAIADAPAMPVVWPDGPTMAHGSSAVYLTDPQPRYRLAGITQ